MLTCSNRPVLASLLFLILFFQGGTLKAQTSVLLRNNTWHDLVIEINQVGPFAMNPGDFSLLQTIQKAWEPDTEIMITDRDAAAVPAGDTAEFEIKLIAAGDILRLRLRLIGDGTATTLDYSFSGGGISHAWFNDGNFHEAAITFGGKSVVVKYKPENNDASQSRDLLFVVHDYPIYEIDSADFMNRNVLNVMAYNIQMLPFGVVSEPLPNERGDLLPAQISPYQDVVIVEEAFDDGPRNDHLKPAMQAAGFPYKTGILNNYFPWNGGVMIFSRWPIETTDEYDFALCGPNAQDCLANKGIMYARINKMGKKYHVFGTHLDAGSDQPDIDAKTLQFREIREFIKVQNIPEDEAVIYGGDFNVNINNGNNLYYGMLDSLDPVLPDPIGFNNSTLGGSFGNIIDHAWGSKKHLIPLLATNEIITMRSIDPILWEQSEFSDHRSCLGRFVYPDLEGNTGDTALCPGDTLVLSVSADIPVGLQWQKDGADIVGETGTQLTLANVTAADAGHYVCRADYQVTFGTGTDTLSHLVFPFGPDVVNASIGIEAGQITVTQAACGVGITDLIEQNQRLRIFPNPTTGFLRISWEESANRDYKDFSGKLRLINATGSVVFSKNISRQEETLDLSDLATGIYFMSVIRDGENRSFSQKVILK